MARELERLLSDLRDSGARVEPLDDGWYAVGDLAFLHAEDADVVAYLVDMPDADVEGVWPDVDLAEARLRLTGIHMEEALTRAHAGVRYAVVDGGQIRTFDSVEPSSLPPSPGEYEWRARPGTARD